MTFEMDAADVPRVTEELRNALDFNNKQARKRGKAAHGAVGSPRALKRKKMCLDGWNMRSDNATWEEVADTVGFSTPNAARLAVLAYARKKQFDAADQYRNNEGTRLETALGVVMGIITDDAAAFNLDLERVAELEGPEQAGMLDRLADLLKKDAELKLKAMDRLVSIGGRMGKVFGYDAPTKVEASGAGGSITVMFDAGMAKAKGMAEPELIVEPQV